MVGVQGFEPYSPMLVSLERFELSPHGPKPCTLPGYAIESLLPDCATLRNNYQPNDTRLACASATPRLPEILILYSSELKNGCTE